MASSQQMLLSKSGSSGFTIDGADFDGTNDFLARTSNFSSPAVDGNTGIFSTWLIADPLTLGASTPILQALKLGGVDDEQDGVFLVTITEASQYAADNGYNGGVGTLGNYFVIWQLLTPGPSGTGILQQGSSVEITASAWHHILVSFDRGPNGALGPPTPTPGAIGVLYIDDVDRSDGLINNPSYKLLCGNGTAPLSGINYFRVGAQESGTTSPVALSPRLDGGLAEVYWAPNQFLDFTVSGNRQLFRSVLGHPVSLGTTGSVPTGTVPKLYLHIDQGENANNFAQNRSGNGDTTVTGSLTTRATRP